MRSNTIQGLGRPRFSANLLAAAMVVLAACPAFSAEAPKPAVKDGHPKLRPGEIKYTTSVTPAEAKPGQKVTYKVTAKLDPTWHTYAYAAEQPKEGPKSTQFDFFDPAGLKPVGDWKPSAPPERKKEPVFPDLEFVEFYEGEVSWSRTLEVPPGTEPGKKTLRCQVYFMICDPKSCKPAYRLTLPEATVTVLTGGATAAAEIAPGETPETAPDSKVNVAGKAESESASTTKTEAPATTKTEASATTTQTTGNDVEKSIDQGLFSFLLFAAAGGLFALIMPCVWPMVPVTVNFFVKQGQKNKGKTTGLAVIYCLSIIGVFTLVGILFSAFLGASSLTRLANTAWLNLLVAGIFIAFGLSLLGLFEISLPGFLLDASSKNEGRGGIVGVIFMALTLTITSFTCTFPVVGGLLVLASQGKVFYPVLGLATFATVLAFPFFLLALAPGLLSKVPKSGDWMNAVKVVGGLVEIGAAFKFVNTAECAYVAPENAWFDAQLVLSIWVALTIICGIYLLGLFRTDHDQGEAKVGPGRILAGALFLCLGLYLAPALFGRPPKGPVYGRLVVGILPADSYLLDAGGSIQRVKAGSPVPELAIEQEKTIINSVTWGMSYEAALAQARKEKKLVLIDFTGVNCANCRLMEHNVLPRSEVTSRLSQFVTIQLYTDFVPIDSISGDQREELGVNNLLREQELTRQTTSPLYVVINPDGQVVSTIGGYNEPGVFVKFLDKALAGGPEGERVAQLR